MKEDIKKEKPEGEKESTALTDYEAYCKQQLEDMLDDMDGRCFGEMAEGQFVRSH